MFKTTIPTRLLSRFVCRSADGRGTGGDPLRARLASESVTKGQEPRLLSLLATTSRDESTAVGDFELIYHQSAAVQGPFRPLTTLYTMATELDNEKDAGDIEVARVQSAYPDDEKAVAAGEPQDVWGEINENGPNYRNLGWIRASVLMIKYQIGLGVLGIVSTQMVEG